MAWMTSWGLGILETGLPRVEVIDGHREGIQSVKIFVWLVEDPPESITVEESWNYN